MQRNDKRERLIEAAQVLFHQQGVNNTTLANIATLAKVPLGNVYYYFKSKDAITLCVLESKRRQLGALFIEWSNQRNAKTRLKLLVNHIASLAKGSAQFGDALGNLCQELTKQNNEVSKAASQLMHDMVNWCQKQFSTFVKEESKATQLALNLVASLQGINLISLTFQDPNFIIQHGQYLTHWIDTI